MAKFFISILFVTTSLLRVDAQEKPTLIPLTLKDDLAKKYSFQFSGIVITNDSIILVAEKCGKIYILNKKNLDIISVKKDLPKDKIESIEGVTLYKGRYLFMLDENKVALFSYDLKGEIPFREIADKELLGLNNKTALEGIAVNEELSICYVLHETASKIFLFDIKEDHTLSRREKFYEILLPDIGWTRHADLYYDSDKFYILSTNYPRTNPAKYGIDVASVNSAGTSLTGEYHMIDLTSCNDLPNHKEYSQNLEGIVKDGNYIYVISDNDQSDTATCKQSPTCKLSLFFKFKTNSN